jgi:hypothetical protein
MYLLLSPSPLQAILTFFSLVNSVYGRPNPSPSVHLDNKDQDHIQLQHALDYEDMVTTAEQQSVEYMPISYGKC